MSDIPLPKKNVCMYDIILAQHDVIMTSHTEGNLLYESSNTTNQEATRWLLLLVELTQALFKIKTHQRILCSF